MSTTVKIFIVINLLMAIAFMWITMTLFATRENWKRRWDQDTMNLTRELKAATQQVTQLSYDKVVAQQHVKMHEAQINELQSKVKELDQQITDQKAEVTKRDTQIAKLNEEIQALLEKNTTLSTTLDQVRQRNSELNQIAQVARAVAFQLNVKLAETEDDYNRATTELQKAREENEAQKKDIAAKEAKLAIIRERHPAIWKTVNDEQGAAKFIQGIVAAVRTNPQGQQDLVMLTVGKEETVEEGMEFIVYRGNQYVCKVRAERVLNDMVACRVIPETWNAQGVQIKQGDLAQNRL